MFAQGHGFTQGIGFGTRENDKFWDLQRGRGSGAESGKRDLMFPPYHQHSSTSSATPSPGVLSFPYGSQPGALYQDANLSQKQKKKGKKHRHANTSSSGGGGLVDLADPSILQARMQHQQQSNAGVGQGLFGGQAEGGYNPSMMYGAGFGRW